MYLLKQFVHNYVFDYLYYLHSTMYLLKPDITDDNYLTEYDLHSTMYLLKQFRSVNVAIQLVYL